MFDANVRRPGGPGNWQCSAEATTRSCGKNYPAWTRTRRDEVAFPFFENGQPLLLTVDTIVSEHYDDRDPIAARLMEPCYFSYNWGWLRWEHWEETGDPPSDIPQRCPPISLSAYPSGGGENWRMMDCRMWTNILPENGERSVQTGWPLSKRKRAGAGRFGVHYSPDVLLMMNLTAKHGYLRLFNYIVTTK
jgi:hypothetical protein